MGLILVLLGTAMALLGGILLVLERSGFRGFPGDIVWQRGPLTIVLPIVSCILLSILLTVIVNLFLRR